MQFVKNLLLSCTLSLLVVVTMNAQETAIVPRLVNFSGLAINEQGKPVSGIAGITFSIYNAQEGGAPLWMETQNVQADGKGNYTVQLGATTSGGLPLDVFASGEARWLGVRVNGGEEQARVLLLSVPYALKAADAQTLGGLPASAFALATATASSGQAPPASGSAPSAGSTPPVGGSGTEDYLPLWTDNNGDLGNSILYQLGTGSAAKVGINEKNPLFTLDVNGQELVRGLFEMATTNYASKSKGYNSNPLNFESSAFNSGTSKYTLNHFQWQAEPTGNNTTTPGATLNLLYGTDPAAPAETGLNLSSAGLFTFVKGQTFPGTGTITGVTAGTDLTGGGTSGAVTLNLDTTKVPQLNSANIFTGNQTVNGNFSATGAVAGSSYQIGGFPVLLGSPSSGNLFLGFNSGNSTMTGGGNVVTGTAAFESNATGARNTVTGDLALQSNTTGDDNTAVGSGALALNNTGAGNTAVGSGALALNATSIANANTAVGYSALNQNTGGANNTAVGDSALVSNSTGNDNTGVGVFALSENQTGTELTCIGYGCMAADGLSNATAIGAHAIVSQSSSLVLGGTGQYAVNVGIGTTTPSNILTIGRGAGHPVSDSWETYSSRRWKTNIKTLPSALAKVEQLRGVSYDLKDSGKHEIGVIAEEVGAVVPEVVTFEDNGKDARGVDYSRLTALLIEAVKRQQQEISTLRAQLRKRDAKEAALETRMDQLERHRVGTFLASAPLH